MNPKLELNLQSDGESLLEQPPSREGHSHLSFECGFLPVTVKMDFSITPQTKNHSYCAAFTGRDTVIQHVKYRPQCGHANILNY